MIRPYCNGLCQAIICVFLWVPPYGELIIILFCFFSPVLVVTSSYLVVTVVFFQLETLALQDTAVTETGFRFPYTAVS